MRSQSHCEGSAARAEVTGWSLLLGGTEHVGTWVRTLFVSGLPMDTHPRELYLLFRPFKGYEGSLMKPTTKQPVGFVIFDNRENAEAAMIELHGMRFDPESQHTLRLEFAKANTRVSRQRLSPPGPLALRLPIQLGPQFLTRDPQELLGPTLVPASRDAWGAFPPFQLFATDLSSSFHGTPLPGLSYPGLAPPWLQSAQAAWGSPAPPGAAAATPGGSNASAGHRSEAARSRLWGSASMENPTLPSP
ncbi:RNA-binding protein, mRNA-processing factor 2a-like [Lethenteron reissneri]|uniref:RNA-binding protein, mRNA-processing factor 2a-like n=1 Tax=Lethenteron reissneri TaxID=7753 RepID=UPI002AB77537|nr:RNA-binding protein, mRNA-processing factor 2a-like [Lethenteron reissneri]XP_061428251.1 RNA-binding protein, mRNA-processing factor 2a-like [Lethenteron reissneri]